jgi:cytoplasmic iron level regulating protein YaaA (DUF328/UPF0246 family)
MLTVISPAKSLDFAPAATAATAPAWQADAMRLAKTARNLTLTQLRALMSISDDLARLNLTRFKAFVDDPAPETIKPAVLAFNGDTYQGLDAGALTAQDLDWAQDRLRILSGLYGLLRPLDAIQPYRLEMGSRLKTRRGTGLYAYWGDRIAAALHAQAQVLGQDVLVNCASEEYFRAADRKALQLRVITPVFLENKGGAAKIVSFFAKRARGAMAGHIIRNRVTEPEALLDFNFGGYAFDPARSTPDRPAFIRDAQPARA